MLRRYKGIFWTLLHLYVIYADDCHINIFGQSCYFLVQTCIYKGKLSSISLGCLIGIANIIFKITEFLISAPLPPLYKPTFPSFSIKDPTIFPVTQLKIVGLFLTPTYPPNHHFQFTTKSCLFCFQIDLKPFNFHPSLSHFLPLPQCCQEPP